MKAWGQPTKGRNTVSEAKQEAPSELDIFLAEEVAQRTRELLATRGWCLWECSALSREAIAVVSDENVQGVPEGYPIYTVAELEELCRDDMSEATLRLVHEAKKLAVATVISVATK